MIVRLIAHTMIASNWAMEEAGYVFQHDALDADELAEFTGRLCYGSWHRPNPETATNEGYLANIIGQQHFSVLEHASATFYVAGVSRSLSHELVRHRHLSFSQRSQRFVDEAETGFVLPPAVPVVSGLSVYVSEHHQQAVEAYQHLVERLLARGLTRKQAREAARCVLPNATETRFVVTGNLRAWREALAKRGSLHADAEIQLLAAELLKQLKLIAPHTFQDM